MVYAGEAWTLKIEQVHRWDMTESMMIGHVCGVTMKNGIATKELNKL